MKTKQIETMKKIAIIIVFAIFNCFSSTAQLKMDMELLGGTIINGSKYNYQDDTHEFELKDGFSYGLGFDLWFPCEYSISFGLIHSLSVARTTMNYPDFSPSYKSIRRYIGTLEDRMFYLGTKKKFHIGPTTSLSPFLGFYYDFYSFDNEDMEKTEIIVQTQNSRLYYEAHHYYARFNSSNDGENNLWGALGCRAGLTLEQDVGRIGKFSLNVYYGIDSKRMNRSIYTYYNYYETDLSTGQELISYSYYNLENQLFRRNMFQIELGFKMPCSMEFGKNKNAENLYFTL
jgi:hypothetical protein